MRVELTSVEVLEFEMEPMQKGVVTWVAEIVPTTDTLCRITCGDKVGFCDFEISNNATRGKHYPTFAVNAFAGRDCIC